ncbi:TPA: EAL domain-containing protein [Legionella pneumophila]|uniref:cyclic-guanylate-specific phosphodiesterase n=4 Tax=Legionella pneumophila TaxID=446 RepID=A0A378K857_LEGPN|nr:EAL domain-containing protein [Legionella pneumophila]MDW8860437.1 EAL domain-containing protein [Legionella pneumophila]MDW8909577.1 EAL domain-containing protein [Legionella pneumophila]MDW8959237.1 EAL domain-containing protein [Legionella pneumophila]MDW9009293.1 EAL domain-containing protein [Legionella pneumophila]MDW9028152.1 EAL domain-containing protein [Legionella pneumophila]
MPSIVLPKLSGSYYISLYLTIVFSTLTLILGLSVIIGWHSGIVFLIQYYPNTVAIVYNTALCFIALSFSIFLFLNWHYKSAIILSLAVFILSGLALAQHVFSINLGIDEIFFHHYQSIENAYAGRMAANTAFCFLLIATALILMNFSGNQPINNSLAGALSLLVFCLAVLFISGYFSDIQQAYKWGNKTPMSINTGIGFLLLSLAMMSLYWHNNTIHQLNSSIAMPYLSSFCIMLTFSLLSFEIFKKEKELNLSTNLSLTTFALGILFSILFGLIIRLWQLAKISTATAKYALSEVNATLESTADGILVVDRTGNVMNYNKRFLNMWYQKERFLKTINYHDIKLMINKQLINRREAIQRINKILKNPDYQQAFELKLKNNTYYHCYTQPLKLDDEIIGRVWSFRDITIPKRLEMELSHQSTHDTLTNLPNKVLAINILGYAMKTAVSSKKIIGVYLLDLDRFTQINDVFGHSKGDEIIKAVSKRLIDCMPMNHVLGRLSGDQFIVIASINNSKEVVTGVTRLMSAFHEPVKMNGHSIKMSCSVGISFYPKDGDTVDTLLSKADIALSRTKIEGRNSFQFYTQEMHSYTLEHILLESELRNAVAKNEFVLYYQPILKLSTLSVIGFEALIRWNHPGKGLILPDKFISLAEEIGVIGEIGDWVFVTVCKQIRAWQLQGFNNLKISINISPKQFKFRHFPKKVNELLSEFQVKPEFIELELTENILIDKSADIIDILSELKGMGIQISIDDFGTGYSCLSYLKDLPINVLKIDQIFVKDLKNNQSNQTLIKAIIAMAKSFNLSLIAEGIQNKHELVFLQNLGCHYGQGYYFYHPMPPEKCTQLLQ